MPDVPQHRVKKTETHEWVIGRADRPTDAKTFGLGIHLATKAMEDMGVDLSYDDSYYVKAGEGGEIILYVKIKAKKSKDKK